MEVILKEDIKGLGYKNDVITVKGGYGRNFLIPQGKALVASEGNKKVLAENVKQAAHKAEKLKAEAQEIADKVGNTIVKVKTKIGEKGKIFGSITSILVADAIKTQLGVALDRKQVDVSNRIKESGEYEGNLDLHKEVQHAFTFQVVGEDGKMVKVVKEKVEKKKEEKKAEATEESAEEVKEESKAEKVEEPKAETVTEEPKVEAAAEEPAKEEVTEPAEEKKTEE